MSRNLKALGLTLVAVLAISALVAQGAQGHIFKAGVATEKVVITGSDESGTNDVLTATGKVECKNTVFQGTTVGVQVEELTIHPTYTECTAAGQPATVTTNDCDYIFKGATNAEGHANAHIECKEGHSIEVNIPAIKVVLKIGKQTPEGGLHYTNLSNHGEGKKEAITIEATLKGIAVKCFGNGVENGGNCFLFGKVGTYTGKEQLTGYEDLGPAETDPTTPESTTAKEGPQVDLTTGVATEKVVITGSDESGTNDVLTATGKVECKNTVFQGTTVGVQVEELTIHPTYTECTAAGQPATVTTNDCDYIFKGATNAEGHANAHIECKEGHSIEVNIPAIKVVLKIGKQTPEGGLHYTNLSNHGEGKKEAITIEATLKGIAVKCFGNGVENGGNCFLFGKVGTYTGKEQLTGYEDLGPAETDPTTPESTTAKEGPQVDLTTGVATEKVVITGSDESGTNDVLTATGKVECKNTVFQGTTVGVQVEELTIHPTYTECTAAGQPATVTTNDCDYIFKGATNAEGHANAHIECKEGHSIEVNIPAIKVVLKIGKQTPEGGLHYTNLSNHGEGKKEAITIEATLKGIAVKCFGNGVENGGNCFLFGKVGTYTGKEQLTGYEDLGPAETDPTTPESTTAKEGPQVDLTIE